MALLRLLIILVVLVPALSAWETFLLYADRLTRDPQHSGLLIGNTFGLVFPLGISALILLAAFSDDR